MDTIDLLNSCNIINSNLRSDIDPQQVYDEMYRIVGIDRQKLINVLRANIKDLIFDSDLPFWTPEKPTLGCCGLVTALAYCYTPLYRDSFTCVIDYFDKDTQRQEHHWIICIPVDNIQITDRMFIQYINHQNVVIVDLSMEQYAHDDINYLTARSCTFQWPSPNKKVRHLAKLMDMTQIRNGYSKIRDIKNDISNFFED